MPIQVLNGNFATGTPKYYNPFSGALTTTQGYFPLPRAVTINTCTIARNAAPGAGEDNIVQFVNGAQGSAATGSDTTLSDTATSASQAVAGTWTASTASAATATTIAQSKHIEVAYTHANSLDEHNTAFSYEDSANNAVDYHGFGAYGYNYGSEVTADQNGFINFGIAADASTTEANVQIPWPIAGYFQYCAVIYYVNPGGGDVTLVMRKDTGSGAADTDLSFTFSDNGGDKYIELNTATTVSVSAGDVISWRFNAATTNNGFGFVVSCGFIVS